MEATLKTLFMPELICSRGEAEPEDNCFDVLKLNSKCSSYCSFFWSMNITLSYFPRCHHHRTQVYPEQKEWILYDKVKQIIREKNLLFS